jgi:hypothetical protein
MRARSSASDDETPLSRKVETRLCSRSAVPSALWAPGSRAGRGVAAVLRLRDQRREPRAVEPHEQVTGLHGRALYRGPLDDRL